MARPPKARSHHDADKHDAGVPPAPAAGASARTMPVGVPLEPINSIDLPSPMPQDVLPAKAITDSAQSSEGSKAQYTTTVSMETTTANRGPPTSSSSGLVKGCNPRELFKIRTLSKETEKALERGDASLGGDELDLPAPAMLRGLDPEDYVLNKDMLDEFDDEAILTMGAPQKPDLRPPSLQPNPAQLAGPRQAEAPRHDDLLQSPKPQPGEPHDFSTAVMEVDGDVLGEVLPGQHRPSLGAQPSISTAAIRDGFGNMAIDGSGELPGELETLLDVSAWRHGRRATTLRAHVHPCFLSLSQCPLSLSLSRPQRVVNEDAGSLGGLPGQPEPAVSSRFNPEQSTTPPPQSGSPVPIDANGTSRAMASAVGVRRPRGMMSEPRMCVWCQETETPQWRAGPDGPGT